jgi:hypothetical protein
MIQNCVHKKLKLTLILREFISGTYHLFHVVFGSDRFKHYYDDL